MRTRAALVWTIVVVCFALLLPAATVAGSRFRTVTLHDVCTLQGGANDYGYAEFTVRAKEVRRSGVSYFKFTTRLQRRVGERWTQVGSDFVEMSQWFPNNRASQTYTVHRHYDFDASAQFYFHRLVTIIEFRSNLAVLKTATRYGTAC